MKITKYLIHEIRLTFDPAYEEVSTLNSFLASKSQHPSTLKSGFNGDYTYIDNLPVKVKMPYEN